MEILLTKQSSFPIAESRSQFEDHHVNYLKQIVLGTKIKLKILLASNEVLQNW